MFRTKFHAIPLALCAIATAALAQTRPAGQAPAPPPAAAEKPEPIPPETKSVTKHEIVLDGKTLKYTAAAGKLLIDDVDGAPYGSIFYVAYTLDDVADARTRPVTFLYNGGPGS
ncbi:MAG: peptidase S10, partial [Acidobacteriota bacterium]|nr:peptidase S10 [Acidobacteriota bacterium]